MKISCGIHLLVWAASSTLEVMAKSGFRRSRNKHRELQTGESVPWVEEFASSAQGSTSDGGPTSWTTEGQMQVLNNILTFRGGGVEAVLTTGEIDISNSPVDVSLDLYSGGRLEANQDYVKFSAIVDNVEVMIGEKWGNQAAGTSISGSIPSGASLMLKIQAYASFNDEYYYMEKLSVIPVADVPSAPIPWVEDFSNMAPGSTADSGPTSWTTVGQMQVQNNVLTFRGGGVQAALTTGKIDISSSPVDVSLDLYSGGNLEANQDYVKLSAIVDNVEVMIGEKWGNQAAGTSIIGSILSGASLMLKLQAYASFNDEYYYMEKLSVVPVANAPTNAPMPNAPIAPVPWVEDFSNLVPGSIADSGPTAWTTVGQMQVLNNVLTFQGGGGVEAVLTTGEIDISNSPVVVSLDLISVGNLETDEDYVKLSAIVDDVEVVIGEKRGDQIAGTSISDIAPTGSSLVLKITAYASFDDEYYNMEKISVIPVADDPIDPVPWIEDFSNLAEGSIADGGPTSWTAVGQMQVQQNLLTFQGGSGVEGVLRTGKIDISNSPVVVSLDLYSGGKLEENEDYVKLLAIVDNVEVMIGERWGNQAVGTSISGSIPRGAFLVLEVHAYASFDGEFYYMESLSVTPDAVAPTCSDGVQNQDEEGVDCGGSTCAACPTCSDGILNQNEEYIDCGGPFCAPCPLLLANGNPIGIEGTCEGPTDNVDGYPCSPFSLQPFGETFTETISFNPGTKTPLGQVCRAQDNHCADVYDYDVVGIEVELFNQVLSGQCVGKPTKLISYGGTVPAETMHVPSGRETYVQFNNKITEEKTPRPEMFNYEGCEPGIDGKSGVPITVHNHGQASLAPFDGFAIDRTCLGETKAYMYPNNRPTTGWFHDHALHQTGANVLYGLYGLYIISEKRSKGGCGEPYNLEDMEEVHMIMNDVVIDQNCNIRFDVDGPHDISYFGDINLVNGHPFPVLSEMERKWYRFRALNAAVSRPYLLRLVTPNGEDVSQSLCQIIGTDGGYLEFGPQPYPGTGLMVGVAERWDFVCDFGALDSAITELVLYNDFDEKRMKDVPYFTFSHFVAKFAFSGGVQGSAPAFNEADFGNIGTFAPRTVLKDAIPVARDMILNREAHRTFDFGRGGGQWVINGETWDTNRVAADNVGQNTWELWEIDTGGGWFHPVHIHLIDFFILAREDVDGVLAPDLYEFFGAPKDTMYLGPGEAIWVIARYGPHKGEFMMHCHNLIHEDDDMLRTYITITNTASQPGGINSGNDDQAFVEVNGIIYDDYNFANPNAIELEAVPTASHPPTLTRAGEFIEQNFYRIFYPRPNDTDAVLNNPWLANSTSQCGTS